MPYFTSKDETPARQQQKRKRYDILLREKIIYIDIGYKSAPIMLKLTSDENI